METDIASVGLVRSVRTPNIGDNSHLDMGKRDLQGMILNKKICLFQKMVLYQIY